MDYYDMINAGVTSGVWNLEEYEDFLDTLKEEVNGDININYNVVGDTHIVTLEDALKSDDKIFYAMVTKEDATVDDFINLLVTSLTKYIFETLNSGKKGEKKPGIKAGDEVVCVAPNVRFTQGKVYKVEKVLEDDMNERGRAACIIQDDDADSRRILVSRDKITDFYWFMPLT